MQIYKDKRTSKYYSLLVQRESNINTFIEVDKTGGPTIDKRDWTFHPTMQKAIIKGFDNLTLINQ